MKLKLIVLLSITFLSWFAKAQTFNWQWANGYGGSWDEGPNSLCIDNNGDIIVLGEFTSNSISLGSFTLNNYSPFYQKDLFLAKFDSMGNTIWAISMGGTGYEYCGGIDTDLNGNIFITGSFSGPVFNIGNLTLTNPNNGYGQFFIAKFDSMGNFLWAKSEGGQNSDGGSAISIDPFGNPIVAGNFSSSIINFGTITLTNPFPGGSLIFVVKYDNDGNVVWAKSSSSDGINRSSGIDSDVSGNIFFTGSHAGNFLTFDNTTLNVPSSNSGDFEIFLFKLNPNGNVIWAKSEGGNYSDGPNSVRVNQNGNVLLTGTFLSSTLTFDTIALGNSNVQTAQMFVVQLDSMGNAMWAKTISGQGNEWVSDGCFDASGNIWITGGFSSSSIQFGSNTLYNNGLFDAFILKYDSSGSELWSTSLGSNQGDMGLAINTGLSGSFIISGGFESPNLQIGNTTINNFTSSNPSYSDFFIAKLEETLTTGNYYPFPEPSIRIFPNPSSGQIQIDCHKEIKEIILFNSLGQIIFQSKATPVDGKGNGFLFSLEHEGIFWVEIVLDDERYTKKIVVSKN